MGEELKNQLKRLLRNMSKRIIRVAIIVPCIILIILSAAIYNVKKHDGTYEEGDWSNPQYGAGQLVNQTLIGDDGEIQTTLTAQEVWDKLIEEDSRVSLYLDEPEELLKLMNAEMVTNYPDLRPNPDEEIDWDTINASLDSNHVQGIIKFKRAQNDGTTQNMIYADYGTFYNWVEQYNTSGDANARENLLTHFTLESSVVRTSTGTTNLDYSGDNRWTDISEAIIRAALASYDAQSSPGGNLCQAWVRQIYTNAGLPTVGYDGAYQAYQVVGVSTDKNNIPMGATVYGTGAADCDGNVNIYGHVGIYIGDIDGDGEGDVMDNVGSIRIQSLSEWIAWQEEEGNTACGGTPGWLGWGWQSGSPTRFLTDEEAEEAEQRLETSSSTAQVEDTGAEGSEETKFYAIVATYSETTETITTNDPRVSAGEPTKTYTATTQKVNYQDFVSGYTMPFDYLWDLLVQSEDKDFVLDLADLVYDSQIEITVHDNLNVHTKEDKYVYTRRERVQTANATVEVEYQRSTSDYAAASGDRGTEQFTRSTFVAEEHDIEPAPCETTVTTETRTNTIETSLTKADVWIVNYQKNYTYSGMQEGTPQPGQVTSIPDVDYGDYEVVDTDRNGDAAAFAQEKETEVRNRGYASVTSRIVSVRCRVWEGVFNITEQITNTTDTSNYVASPPDVEEKTDKNDSNPNFVTILLDDDNLKAKRLILGSAEWLFDLLSGNDKTKDMIDITKYLLYKASGRDYGITEFDFNTVYNADSFSGGTAMAGDLIVKTDEPNAAPTVDKNTLENGIRSWVSGQQQTNALRVLDKVMEIESTYKINAVFTYALLQQESGIGTANSTWVAENNWTSLTSLGHIYYNTPQENIEKFATSTLCGSYYFAVGRCSVYQIGEKYCADPPPPIWAQEVIEKMVALYTACGVEVDLSGGGNQDIINIAQQQLGVPYSWGGTTPSGFDCSGLVYYCYQQVGISVPRSTSGYSSYRGSANEISWEEAQPGDILIIFPEERTDGYSTGHAGIYIGNDSYIHAPGTGDVVKQSSGAQGFFRHVFRFN